MEQEKPIEFKSQFMPALLKAVSAKVFHRDGGKHYVANFLQGRYIVHVSLKQFKTKTLAQEYAHAVLQRYEKLHVWAQWAFISKLDAVKE